MQNARLVLLRGNGGDGGTYFLNSKEHLAGRNHGMILFPDDRAVSPAHANFYFRDERLYLRDLGSANGTFIRLRSRVPLQSGDRFVCGEQMFEYTPLQDPVDDHWERGVCYCGSAPLWDWRYQIRQILSWEREGIVRSVSKGPFTIGRDNCSLSFPRDRYISQSHARIVQEGPPENEVLLEDTNSKNGTYYRIRQEVGLLNGDYLFIGKQLIRVELR